MRYLLLPLDRDLRRKLFEDAQRAERTPAQHVLYILRRYLTSDSDEVRG